MTDDKLKELEERIEAELQNAQFHLEREGQITIDAQFVSDLITSYRELQKDREPVYLHKAKDRDLITELKESQTKDRATIKELLSALKQARRKLAVDGRIDLDNLIIRIDELITKHSTDTDKTKGE